MATTSVMAGPCVGTRTGAHPGLRGARGRLTRTGMLQVAFVRSPVAERRSFRLTPRQQKPCQGRRYLHPRRRGPSRPAGTQVPIEKLPRFWPQARSTTSVRQWRWWSPKIANRRRMRLTQSRSTMTSCLRHRPEEGCIGRGEGPRRTGLERHPYMDLSGYWEALGLEDQTPQVDAAMERETPWWSAWRWSTNVSSRRHRAVRHGGVHKGHGQFTSSADQVPHALRRSDRYDLRNEDHCGAVMPEVGGGFGSKLNVYNDEILAAFAAKELGAP